LGFFVSQVSKRHISAFETLTKIWVENGTRSNSNVTPDILVQLQALKSNISKYFTKNNLEMKWIIKPFEEDYIKNIPESIFAKESFIDQ